MIPLAIDSLGLAFAGYIVIAAVVAIALGRAFSLNDRLSRQQMAPVMQDRREQEARERALSMRQGPLSEWAAESRERRQRAELRHVQRLNEKSGPRRANDRAA